MGRYLRLQVMRWACGHEFPMSTIGCQTAWTRFIWTKPCHQVPWEDHHRCFRIKQATAHHHVQTLKAREPKRWKIETSSCSRTLKDGSNFQSSGSFNASGGCGEQQTSTSPVLPLFFAPQNESFLKNKIVKSFF